MFPETEFEKKTAGKGIGPIVIEACALLVYSSNEAWNRYPIPTYPQHTLVFSYAVPVV